MGQWESTEVEINEWLKAEGGTDVTQREKIAVLRRFMRWYGHGMAEIVSKIKRRGPTDWKAPVGVSGVEALFVPSDNRRDIEAKAGVCLAILGLTLPEMMRLEVTDIRLDAGYINVVGSRKRIVSLPAWGIVVLEEYLESRRRRGVGLFMDAAGTVRGMISRYCLRVLGRNVTLAELKGTGELWLLEELPPKVVEKRLGKDSRWSKGRLREKGLLKE
tara:strand:+ start:128 stop:778 length:651 start_codon:yes stop_codon:yes gene_type:complete